MQPRLHPDRPRPARVHDDILMVALIAIVLAVLLFVLLATPAHGLRAAVR